MVEHKDIDVSLSRNNPGKAESMINWNGRETTLSLSLRLLFHHKFFFLGFDLLTFVIGYVFLKQVHLGVT